MGELLSISSLPKMAVTQTRTRQGLFQKADVTNWESLRNLFEAAKAKFGSVDVVLANAGVPERPPFLFDDNLDEDGLLKEPDFNLIDINLNGVLRSMLLSPRFEQPGLNFTQRQNSPCIILPKILHQAVRWSSLGLRHRESISVAADIRRLTASRYFASAPIVRYGAAKHAVRSLPNISGNLSLTIKPGPRPHASVRGHDQASQRADKLGGSMDDR
jgi:NAD(P)-dependent dehydrogenase (short-subunit alcohol dehydrogenase family)